MAHQSATITVTRGNGIGPEIMAVALEVLREAGASLDIEEIEVGESLYARGIQSGIDHRAWESLRRTRAFLKAPLTTPEGKGLKSVNVTMRNGLGLYANIRPCPSYAPFVSTKHPEMNVVIVRENEEDLYTGIEHRQSEDVAQCLKLISRPASERIIRYAFEYARRSGRAKVTCFTKDNIMKLTDGLFHQVFDEVSEEYPDIASEHWIVDIGAAMLANTPEAFDVIVLPNLYGDVLSDVAAQISGSVGLGGSANIGDGVAMFEAIHGSAPRIAGRDVANPSGLLLASVQMLEYLGQGSAAELVHNAWLKTIEDGIHTVDIFNAGVSREQVGTTAFGRAVIARLGKLPETLAPVSYGQAPEPIVIRIRERVPAAKVQVGIDVFFQSNGDPDELVKTLQEQASTDLDFVLLSNRAQLIYPSDGRVEPRSDHYRCRFENANMQSAVSTSTLLDLLARLDAAGIAFIKTEGLYTFDGISGYSVGQGQ